MRNSNHFTVIAAALAVFALALTGGCVDQYKENAEQAVRVAHTFKIALKPWTMTAGALARSTVRDALGLETRKLKTRLPGSASEMAPEVERRDADDPESRMVCEMEIYSPELIWESQTCRMEEPDPCSV